MGSVSANNIASLHGPFGASFCGTYTLHSKTSTTRRLTMKAADAALQIKIPRNKTVLMQLLQLLVFRRHYWWCSGIIDAAKLGGFVAKMAVRYPLTRTARGRAYDRTRGLAAMHFVAYPLANGLVAWWLLSDDGTGGLNDPATPDAHVATNAMASDGHITFTDYVLHYAHKKSPRHLPVNRHEFSRHSQAAGNTAFHIRPATSHC